MKRKRVKTRNEIRLELLRVRVATLERRVAALEARSLPQVETVTR